MYTHVHVISMYIYIYMYLHMYTYINTFICIYMCIYVYTYTYIHMPYICIQIAVIKAPTHSPKGSSIAVNKHTQTPLCYTENRAYADKYIQMNRCIYICV